jgi:YbbR domain-containing protein
LLKWLPIGIIPFLLVTILWLWVNQTPKTTDNQSQIAQWQQSHQQLTQIKQTVLAEQTPWSVERFLKD